MRSVIYLLFFINVIFCFSLLQNVYSQSGGGSVEIGARVQGCGDEIVDVGEDCDTADLNGKTCATQGFTSGPLACTASCTFNTAACVLESSNSNSSGGSRSNKAQVVLVGRAYPKSTITILKDAQVVATTIADEDARFQVNVNGLSSGSYNFSIYVEDVKGVRSSLLTFPVVLTKGILAKIENIFIAPTIISDKSEVKKGDMITLFGQSTPASEIILEVNSNQQMFFKTNSDSSGIYFHRLDTSVLELGEHHAKSRSSFESMISSQSEATSFIVGDKNVLIEQPRICPQKADLNNDCKVNLVDFSIAAFWYNRTIDGSFLLREREKLNADGKINVVDFSIMAFYWTG